MSNKPNPFIYLSHVNKGTDPGEDVDETIYNQFLMNRGLSYHLDTVAIVNQVNMYSTINDQMHFDYLKNMVSPGNRYSKWHKPKEHEDAKAISEYYNLTLSKSYDLIGLFSKEELSEIKKELKVE